MKVDLTKVQIELLLDIVEEDLIKTKAMDMQYKGSIINSLSSILKKLNEARDAIKINS